MIFELPWSFKRTLMVPFDVGTQLPEVIHDLEKVSLRLEQRRASRNWPPPIKLELD